MTKSLLKALKCVVAESVRTIKKDALDKDKSCGIISTYRQDQSHEANRSSLTSLRDQAQGLGFECELLKGYWEEDGEELGEEQSIFLVAESGSAQDLLAFLSENAEKFLQDGFLFRNEGEEITQLHLDGEVQGLGKFREGRFGEFYSKIKGKPFTFV